RPSCSSPKTAVRTAPVFAVASARRVCRLSNAMSATMPTPPRTCSPRASSPRRSSSPAHGSSWGRAWPNWRRRSDSSVGVREASGDKRLDRSSKWRRIEHPHLRLDRLIFSRGWVFTLFDASGNAMRLLSLALGGLIVEGWGIRPLYWLGGGLLAASGLLGLLWLGGERLAVNLS